MVEGFFALVCVVVGALLTVAQGWFSGRKSNAENARYLAIRVVCALDKYVEDSAEVASDDGLSFGQRTADGYLEPQVALPAPIAYPPDTDWRSIEHDLMYELLSLPNEGERANGAINFSGNIASPPDFDEYFEEAKQRYGELGLKAATLAKKLRDKYHIPSVRYGSWDPVERLKKEKAKVEEISARREASMGELLKVVS